MVAKRTKKRKSSGGYQQKLYLVLALCLIIFLVYSNVNMLIARVDTTKDVEKLTKEQEDLNTEKGSLEASLGETSSNFYLEKKAREDLGFQMPGERIFVIKKEEKGTLEDTLEQEINVFQKILNLFK